MKADSGPSLCPPTVGARKWALFLDVDGTLLDIAATPETAKVPDDLPGILLRLSGWLDGAVALVSGRALADIDRMFFPLRLPAAGQHGAELRDIGGRISEAPGTHGGLDAIRALLSRRFGELTGVLIEDKGMSIAVHYRLAPEHGAYVRAAAEELADPHAATMTVLHGKQIVEFKSHAICKGTAVTALMDAPPFRGRVPVFIGDDRTDEDGFLTAARLGGLAIRVGDGPGRDAPWYFATPYSLRAWLAGLPDRPADAPARGTA